MASPDRGPTLELGGQILVGVDATEGSQHALAWTAGVARLAKAAVEVVHVSSPWVGLELAIPPFDYEEYRSVVAKTVAEWADRLGGVEFETKIVEDNPAQGLLTVAEEINPDLIVVGSHGHDAWAPHLLGSVTSKLLHLSAVPVVVVPPTAKLTPADGRIVVGADGSAPSLRAVRWAANSAKVLGADVYVLAAYPFEAYAEKPRLAEADSDDPVADTLSAVRALADQVAAETGTTVTSDVLIGHPAARLLDAVRDEYALVLGSTGHGSFASVLFGSTSRTCVAHAEVPTIVVP